MERLKLYKSKLLVFPRGAGKKARKKGDTARSELQNVAQNTLKDIIREPKPELWVKARAVTAEEKVQSAYKLLKNARSAAKYEGECRKKVDKGEED